MAADPWEQLPADAYTLLGVTPDVDTAGVRAAWRTAARTHHPDRGGNPETFAAAKTAYDILSNTTTRARYDRWRTSTSTSTSAQQRPAPGASAAGRRRGPAQPAGGAPRPTANTFSWAGSTSEPATGRRRRSNTSERAPDSAGGANAPRGGAPRRRHEAKKQTAQRPDGRAVFASATSSGGRYLYGVDVSYWPSWLVWRDTGRLGRAAVAAWSVALLSAVLGGAAKLGVTPWHVVVPHTPLRPGNLGSWPVAAMVATVVVAAVVAAARWNTPVTVTSSIIGAAGAVGVFYAVAAAVAATGAMWVAGFAAAAVVCGAALTWLWWTYRRSFHPPVSGWVRT